MPRTVARAYALKSPMYMVCRWSIADLNGLVRLDRNGNRFADGGDPVSDRCALADIDLARARQRGASRSAGHLHFLRRVDAECQQADESIHEALLRLDGSHSV